MVTVKNFENNKNLDENEDIRREILLTDYQSVKKISDLQKENNRINRYFENYITLKNGMESIGFKCFLPDNLQGHFITSFLYYNARK